MYIHKYIHTDKYVFNIYIISLAGCNYPKIIFMGEPPEILKVWIISILTTKVNEKNSLDFFLQNSNSLSILTNIFSKVIK